MAGYDGSQLRFRVVNLLTWIRENIMKRGRLLIALALATVVLAIGVQLLLKRRAPEMTPIPASGGSSQLNIRLENIPYYLQNDPQWGAETLGGTNERMAAAGCTVTCV